LLLPHLVISDSPSLLRPSLLTLLFQFFLLLLFLSILAILCLFLFYQEQLISVFLLRQPISTPLSLSAILRPLSLFAPALVSTSTPGLSSLSLLPSPLCELSQQPPSLSLLAFMIPLCA